MTTHAKRGRWQDTWRLRKILEKRGKSGKGIGHGQQGKSKKEKLEKKKKGLEERKKKSSE